MAARSRGAVAGAAVAALLVTLLGACSSDGSGTDPVEVEVGEEFTWNDFTVEEGWSLKPVERTIDVNETLVSPEVSGSIVNNLDEERAPIFQMVFSQDGDDLATVNCSAMKLIKDQAGELLCPGFGATMPLDYDTVTVQPFQRGEGGPSSAGL